MWLCGGNAHLTCVDAALTGVLMIYIYYALKKTLKYVADHEEEYGNIWWVSLHALSTASDNDCSCTVLAGILGALTHENIQLAREAALEAATYRMMKMEEEAAEAEKSTSEQKKKGKAWRRVSIFFRRFHFCVGSVNSSSKKEGRCRPYKQLSRFRARRQIIFQERASQSSQDAPVVDIWSHRFRHTGRT